MELFGPSDCFCQNENVLRSHHGHAYIDSSLNGRSRRLCRSATAWMILSRSALLTFVPDSTGGTRTGALGKFVYAAPESLESAEHADQRCDIYSLGMTAIFGYHGKRVPPAAFTWLAHSS